MITLYTVQTGNGYRASIMLEEVGLPYQVKALSFQAGDLKTPQFLAINPVGKAPAIVDDDGPDGQPVLIGETLAIALYLCEKSGKLMPSTAQGRAQAWQWGAIMVSGLAASFTATFFSKITGEADHGKIIDKHMSDVGGYLKAMDTVLGERRYLAGDDYSFADVLAIPALLSTAPQFGVDLSGLPHLLRWRDEVAARPAVKKGSSIPA